MSVFRDDDGKRLHGDFGGVPVLHDQVAVGVDEVAAVGAAQQGPRIHDVRVGEDVMSVELLLEGAPAARAVEALVEVFESVRFGSENILLPLDGSENVFGVHLFEDSHETTVSMVR